MARKTRGRRASQAVARVGALAVGALLVPTMAAPPAHAGLLDPVTDPVSSLTGGLLDPVTDPLLDTVDGVVDPLTGLLSSLGPTGWLYDDSQASMGHVRSVIGADGMWSRGWTGQGVGVAVIDTGVVPVKGLTSGNVVDGADLSFESQSEDARHLDTFGHGTHMTGIIGGDEPHTLLGPAPFRGVAPDAKVTSIKVGAHDGAVDVSQVIAAVDWVVEHRNDDPRNPIRVLNLSYGTDGVQDYRVDPLAHAVENAWRAGIVVVVSGGNDGFAHGKLNNPGYDPYVLTVGAADTKGTTATLDDTVPPFSSRGDAERRVDLVAPGRSIVSLRDPGSYLDVAHPGARVGDRFFKGSGTSQAAAVVSGAVALLLEQRPSLTPDQVKALLVSTAARMPNADAAGRGAGELNLTAASFIPPSIRPGL
jgi:serine protease AprX